MVRARPTCLTQPREVCTAPARYTKSAMERCGRAESLQPSVPARAVAEALESDQQELGVVPVEDPSPDWTILEEKLA